jgi:hypothetical protein
VTEFYRRGNKRKAHCKHCANAALKEWRKKNPDQARGHYRAAWKRRRDSILRAYGNACACCGRTDRLEIDHVNGGGAQHSRRRGPEGVHRDVIKSGFSDEYQLLCAPCNIGKNTGEYCDIPEHQQYHNR